jgi:aspartate racemase
MKPTIGIIGGCGPLATVDIEYKILQATRRLLSPLIDQNYFNMLVFNYTQFSDRNDAIAINDKTLPEQFLKCARALETIGIDLLLIACQTAHVYVPNLKSVLGLPIVDLIEETVRFILKSCPGTPKVGLLSTEATQKKQLYQNALSMYGIEVITVSADIQKKIMEAIYIIKTGTSVKTGRKYIVNDHYHVNNTINYPEIKKHPYKQIVLEKFFPNPVSTIIEAVHYLENNGCQHVILGCTELPLILPSINLDKIGVNLIDPNTIVAESAVILAHRLDQEKMGDILFSKNIANGINDREVFKLCVE